MRAEEEGPHRAGEVRVVVGEDERREGVGCVNEARTPLWALPSRFRGEVPGASAMLARGDKKG